MVYSRVQARYTIGAAAVVFDERGSVLIVEHAYHPRFPWGLPGGWIEANEDPAAGILRELKEELQLDALVTAVVNVCMTAPGHIDLAFLCEAKSPVGNLSHELLDYKWVNLAQLPELKPFHRRAIAAAQQRRSRDA